MGDTHVNVISLWPHNREDVCPSPVLPKVLARFSPRLPSSAVDSIHQAVDNLIVSATCFAASFVTEHMPGIILEVFPTYRL